MDTTIIKTEVNPLINLEPSVIINKETWRERLWTKLTKPSTKKQRKPIPKF